MAISNDDYEDLARILRQIINQPDVQTWDEKKDKLDEAMIEHDGTVALQEIISWYSS